MLRFLVVLLGCLGLSGPVLAECFGTNLVDQLPDSQRQTLFRSVERVPFARGNFWQAEKDGQTLTLLGTYHLDDPRHGASLAAIEDRITTATTVLVEAGPQEEAALKQAMVDDPALLFITEGPSLLEQLPRDTWRRLSEALEARGVPSFLAAKFQPWYATAVLAIPPCQMASGDKPEGLDAMVIKAAEAAAVPLQALEPYDTIFKIFDAFNAEQTLGMIESSLAMEGKSEDMAVTLADLYFSGDSRLIWELTRIYGYDQPGYTHAEVDAEMALMEQVLMVNRNRAWIPVIEAAAARGPALVAFGALHLSGEAGVLNLLADAGWVLKEIPLPQSE